MNEQSELKICAVPVNYDELHLPVFVKTAAFDPVDPGIRHLAVSFFVSRG